MAHLTAYILPLDGLDWVTGSELHIRKIEEIGREIQSDIHQPYRKILHVGNHCPEL